MNLTWIKCYRSLMDSEIWADEWLVKLWLWCLFKANHKELTFKGQVVARGQFITGRHTASDELGVSPSKWYRGIERLVSLGCIETASNKHWTTVTVCNYSAYQDRDAEFRTASEQPVNNKRTTDEQQMNNQRTQEKELQNDRSISTSARAAEAQPLRTWSMPPVVSEMPGVPEAIERWQKWVACVDERGRPWDQARLEAAVMNKLSAGWDAAKIVDSINKSIEWGARSWRDPAADHDAAAVARARRSQGKGIKYVTPGNETPF